MRLNAVVGVKGTVERGGQLTSVGITCALCHSSVDNSFATGIGRRLDGWANTDLNVGAIVALSPALDRGDEGGVQRLGPGQVRSAPSRVRRHDHHPAEHARRCRSSSRRSTGSKGVGFETFTGDGPISYWNSYVGVGQMGGKGNFIDPRIGLFIKQTPDLVTPKLPALLDYQLSLLDPAATAGQLRSQRPRARQSVFRNRRCATCHRCRRSPTC